MFLHLIQERLDKIEIIINQYNKEDILCEKCGCIYRWNYYGHQLCEFHKREVEKLKIKEGLKSGG